MFNYRDLIVKEKLKTIYFVFLFLIKPILFLYEGNEFLLFADLILKDCSSSRLFVREKEQGKQL